MSRFKNEVAHLQAHVKTLRLGAGALFVVALLLGFGWWSAPKDLTIHVPPDLRSGSTRKWWDVPPESVYAFSFYIWQQVQRTGKELRPTSVVTFMSQRREAVEEAYAGDIIGFTTHGGVQLGDTITDGANLQFTGLPFFAPEMFMTVVLKNPLRTKQLQQGLMQLGEEGAIQVFKPQAGGNMLLGAVGQLQFEVVQHRLNTEYDCDVRLEGCQYTGARWITADTPADLRAFTDAYPMRLSHDAANALAYLCTSPYDVRLAQERFPKIHFHPLREHAGLALQINT